MRLLFKNFQNSLLTTYKPIILILILALLIRLFFYWFYPNQNFPDAEAYRTIGMEIFAGQTITNNIYMPLYPIWVYLTNYIWSQFLADILISVTSVLIIFLISKELFNNTSSAILAAFISAFYPHFIFYSISGLTEVFFTFLLLVTILLFYKKKTFLAIIVCVLSLLVRPTFDLLNPFLIIVFVGLVNQAGFKNVFKYLLIYLAVYVVIFSPWWFHQYDKYGEFVRLNLGDGIVLYSGNNPINKSGGGVGRETGESDMNLSQFNHIKNPIEKNNLMKQEAIEYILANPRKFIEMAGVKLVRFWRLWPFTEHYQQWYIIASSLMSYGVVFFMSIGFVLKEGRKFFRKLVPIYTMIFYLTLVHIITIGSIRYRFPLEPFLIIFASHFFVNFFKENKLMIFLNKVFNLN